MKKRKKAKHERKEEREEKSAKGKIKKVKAHLHDDMKTFVKEKKDDAKLLKKLLKKGKK